MCLLKLCSFAPTAQAAVYGPRCKTSLASLQYVKQCNSQNVCIYWHDKAVTMEPVLTFKSGVGERWIRVEESHEQKNMTKQKSSFVTGGGPTLIYFPLLLTLLACLLPHEDTRYCVDGNLMATMQCMWVSLLLTVVFSYIFIQNFTSLHPSPATKICTAWTKYFDFKPCGMLLL